MISVVKFIITTACSSDSQNAPMGWERSPGQDRPRRHMKKISETVKK